MALSGGEVGHRLKAVSDRTRFSNDAFTTRIREYLTMEATAMQLDAPEKGNALDSGLADNFFYEFDADSLIAIWHAVEDLALEEANGSLIASVQEFSWLESQRERYEQLALTLDHVEVIGAGPTPRRIPRLKFGTDKKGALRKFRSVLYKGPRLQVAFVAEQADNVRDFEARRFVGFYTFEARLIDRLRADLIREFARQRAIYDAGREIQRELTMQREALAKAVRRLRLDGDRYHAREFVSELEKGLSRLVQWKNKLPKLIEQVEGN